MYLPFCIRCCVGVAAVAIPRCRAWALYLRAKVVNFFLICCSTPCWIPPLSQASTPHQYKPGKLPPAAPPPMQHPSTTPCFSRFRFPTNFLQCFPYSNVLNFCLSAGKTLFRYWKPVPPPIFIPLENFPCTVLWIKRILTRRNRQPYLPENVFFCARKWRIKSKKFEKFCWIGKRRFRKWKSG